MVYLLTTIHVIVSVFLIIVVLLQSGKAADLAGAFGGMGSQTVFGPLAGALFFTLAPEWLRASDQWRYVLFALFLILFMAVRPQGLITTSLFHRRRPANRAAARSIKACARFPGLRTPR